MKQPTDPLPALKRPPKFGVYLWWPEEGTSWVHPEDVGLATSMIQGPRIFKRTDLDEDYSKLEYGETQIRVRPTLWLEVDADGYELGDFVEVKSRMGQDEPLVAEISDIFWNHHTRIIEYYLSSAKKSLPNPYEFAQIQPVQKLDEPMSIRQMELAAKSRLR